MTIHKEPHPQRHKNVTVRFAGEGHPQLDGLEHEAVLEDYWDRVYGGSWMFAEGNPAALVYAFRSATNGLPMDNQVVYVKIGAFGHIVHLSELVTSDVRVEYTGNI